MSNEMNSETQLAGDETSQNRFKTYLENNPVRGSFILIGLSVFITLVTYYDYFLDGDDYVFLMLPLLTAAMILTTLIFVVSNIIKKIKGDKE